MGAGGLGDGLDEIAMQFHREIKVVDLCVFETIFQRQKIPFFL